MDSFFRPVDEYSTFHGSNWDDRTDSRIFNLLGRTGNMNNIYDRYYALITDQPYVEDTEVAEEGGEFVEIPIHDGSFSSQSDYEYDPLLSVPDGEEDDGLFLGCFGGYCLLPNFLSFGGRKVVDQPKTNMNSEIYVDGFPAMELRAAQIKKKTR